MDFLRALGFLTILPCPRLESTPEDLGRSSGWFPLAGALLGGLLAAAHAGLALLLFPPAAASLTVVLWAFLTRGLHLDGLADTADGLAASYDRQRALDVMRRGDTGPAGAATLVLVLLLQAAALAQVLSGGGTRIALVVALAAVG